MISPARQVAFQVLERVENGGYASDLLLTQAARLERRDAGLASELVFGCLRFQSQLDYLIERRAKRPVRGLDTAVRLALRMGIYQLRYLDRIPRHAAVSESVELVKHARKHSAAGLVNAILRRTDREEVSWPDAARTLALPGWLLDGWTKQFGGPVANGIAQAFLQQPEAYIRVPHGAVIPPDMSVEPTDIPGCYRLLSGDPGPFRIQDIGSQSIVPLLDLKPGMTFWDVCAAPGNKTAQALEAGVYAVASDLYWNRLEGLKKLGIPLVNLDATQTAPFRTGFDRILIDAPCSGTGTLGRNPEIKWRIQPSDLDRFAERQRSILRQALNRLAPGGVLVYSTCSLETAENEDVVTAVLRETGHRLISSSRRTPGLDPGDGFYAAVITLDKP